MGKFIKTVENVYNKALRNKENGKEGFAKVNGRMSEGRYIGPLEEKYSVLITDDEVILKHWGTMTLEFDRNTKKVIYSYGQSNSDRDSIDTILTILGVSNKYEVRYLPSKDDFIFNEIDNDFNIVRDIIIAK